MKEIHLTVWEKYVCLGWESSFLRRRASFPRRTSYRLPRVLYNTLELSRVQVVYCRAFWATIWYPKTFYRIRLDAWWQTFAWRGFTGTIREWAAKCAMYAQFKGVTGERMRQQQFCLTIWIWGVGEASSTTISLTGNNNNNKNNNNNNKLIFSDYIKKQQLH